MLNFAHPIVCCSTSFCSKMVMHEDMLPFPSASFLHLHIFVKKHKIVVILNFCMIYYCRENKKEIPSPNRKDGGKGNLVYIIFIFSSLVCFISNKYFMIPRHSRIDVKGKLQVAGGTGMRYPSLTGDWQREIQKVLENQVFLLQKYDNVTFSINDI